MNDEKSNENKESYLLAQNSSNSFLLIFSNIKGHIKLLNEFIEHFNQYFDIINVFYGQLNSLNSNFLKESHHKSSIMNSPIFHLGKIIKDIIQLQINNLLNITKNQKIFKDITNELSTLIKVFKHYNDILGDTSQSKDKPNSTIQPVLLSLMDNYDIIESKIIDQYITDKYKKTILRKEVDLERKIIEANFLEKTFLEFEESSKKIFFKEYQEIEKDTLKSLDIIKNLLKILSENILKPNNFNLYEIQNEIDYIKKITQLKDKDKTKDSNINISQNNEDLFKYRIKIIMMPAISVFDINDNKLNEKSESDNTLSKNINSNEEKKIIKKSFWKKRKKEKEMDKEEKNKEEELILTDEDIFCIVKNFYNLNFKLIDKSFYILDIEKEKIEIRKLGKKLLQLDLTNNMEEMISDSEVEFLIELLNKKENIYNFFLIINNYRTTGRYELTERTYNIMLKIFNNSLDFLLKNRSNEIESLIIILSQTFYIMKEGTKKFIQEGIKNHSLFRNKEFWEQQVIINIEEHIEKSENHIKKMNLSLSEMEKKKRLDEIILSQFVPLSRHMINFEISNDIILEIAKKIFEEYKTGEETKNIILSLLKG